MVRVRGGGGERGLGVVGVRGGGEGQGWWGLGGGGQGVVGVRGGRGV